MSESQGFRTEAGPKSLGPAIDVVAMSLGRGANNYVGVPVEVRTASGWTPVQAMLDCGSPVDMISHVLAKELDLQGPELGGNRLGSLSGHRIQTYGSFTGKARMSDASGETRAFSLRVIAADITGFDLILGLPWIRSHRPAVDWSTSAVRWPAVTDHEASASAPTQDGLVAFCSAEEFDEHAKQEGAELFGLRCVDPTSDGDTLAAATTDDTPTVPPRYSDFADVFSEEEANRLPEHGPQDHAIEIDPEASGSPPWGPLYNLSATELKALRENIAENLKKGFIRPSSSPAGAPILFIKKKDGSLRLCVDYRGLNRLTVKNRYPLPLLTEALDRLVGAKIYTKLDIRSAYNLIRIREGDEWKTAFRTRYGHFEYQVMPFGLANAPATFQSYINRALREYLDVFCIAYLDDILIFSDNEEVHEEHVRMVLGRLRQFRLFGKLVKCVFHTRRVGFVGFVLTPGGVSMEDDRIKTVKEWPLPKTHRDIQVFLGFANFYRRFIAHYSRICRPLTALLTGAKKGKFKGRLEMTPAAIAAFDRLKIAFSEGPVLRHYDPELPIKLDTDASKYAMAAVLFQKFPIPDNAGRDPGPLRTDPAGGTSAWHPIAYWSRQLVDAELNYGIGDTELMAIVMACKHWRHYLAGASHPILVYTDHLNLRSFLTTKSLTGRQARWWEGLSELNLEILHQPGASNPADAPSRRPDYVWDDEPPPVPAANEPSWYVPGPPKAPRSFGAHPDDPRDTVATAAAVITPSHRSKGHATSPLDDSGGLPITVAACLVGASTSRSTSERIDVVVRQLQPDDPLALAVTAELRDLSGTQPRRYLKSDKAQWRLSNDGLLHWGTALYLPVAGGLRAEMLRETHNNPLGGHFGLTRTLELIRREFYWPHMAKEVKGWVAGCTTCQRSKVPRHKPYGELAQLPRPEKPFDEITMDFITGCPPSGSRGKAYDSILVVVDRLTKLAHYIPVKKTIDAPHLATVFFKKWVLRGCGVPRRIISDRGSLFTSRFWEALCAHLGTSRGLSTAFHPQTDGQTERQNQTLEQYLRAYVNYQQDDWVSLLPYAQFAYNNSVQATTGTSPYELLTGCNPSLGRYHEQLADEVREVPEARARAQQVRDLRDAMGATWDAAVASQAKHYDRGRTPRTFRAGDKVWLNGKNIRSIRPVKKLDHKFYGPYNVIEPIGRRAYRLDLRGTLKVHPVFHVALLEPYVSRLGEEPPEPPAIEVEGDDEFEVDDVLDSRWHRGKLQYLVHWKGYADLENSWVAGDDMGHAEERVREFHAAHPDRPSPPNRPEKAGTRKRRGRKGRGRP